jgi:hypothetical protein
VIAARKGAGYIFLNDGLWPIPPIQDTQIIGYQIAALRHIADGRPAVSPIGANSQKRNFPKLDSARYFTPPRIDRLIVRLKK